MLINLIVEINIARYNEMTGAINVVIGCQWEVLGVLSPLAIFITIAYLIFIQLCHQRQVAIGEMVPIAGGGRIRSFMGFDVIL